MFFKYFFNMELKWKPFPFHMSFESNFKFFNNFYQFSTNFFLYNTSKKSSQRKVIIIRLILHYWVSIWFP